MSREGQRWIGFRSEEDNTAGAKAKAPGLLWQNQHLLFGHESVPAGTSRDLPPREVLGALLAIYQQSEFSSCLPLIDPVLFATTVDKAYENNHPGSDEALPAKACVFAFLALRSLMGDRGEEPQSSHHIEGCDVAGQLLIPNLLGAQPTTEVLDALVMIVSCLFLLPSPFSSLFTGQHCRYLLAP